MNPPRTIMVVDDDVDFVEITRTVLESAGYHAVCCYSRREAAERLAGDPRGVDLVITDLMMESLDAGFAFARGLKTSPATAHLPVIMATSASHKAGFDFRPRTPQELAEMSIDAFFEKPIRPQQLLTTVEQLLSPKPSA